MRRFPFFWLFFLFIHKVEIINGQPIVLQGIVLDDSTNYPVSEATIQLINKGNFSLRSVKTNQKGEFTLQDIENILTIKISKGGYYPFQTEIHFFGKVAVNFQTVFYVPLKLSRIPSQYRDKPYEQETQRHFELGKGATEPATFTRKITFVNSETNRPVKAELCLIPTRTGRRECVLVREEGYNASFVGMDIIALEVKSAGFYDFYGNLILTDSEKPMGEYQVRLRPVQVMVGVGTSSPTDSIQILSDTYKDYLQKISAHAFCLTVPKTGRYLLKMAAYTGHYQQEVFLQTGLNLIGLSVNSDTICDVLHRGERIIITFPQSSYELSADSKAILDQLANCTQDRVIAIVGHTEPIGNEKLNKTLSEFRAKMVFNYLIRRGLLSDQLHDSGVGSTQPATSTQLETDRRLNRRVEIFLKN